MEETNSFKKPFFVYDSKCPLCVRFMQSVQRLEKDFELHYYDLHDEEIYKKFSFLNFDSCSEQLHLVDEDEQVLKGSEAILWLSSRLPLVKKFSWLIESEKGQKAVDLFYTVANKYRETLAKRCPECTKSGKKRHWFDHSP